MAEDVAMPPDEAIAKRLREILEAADLAVVTTKAIRLQLEQEMGISMDAKKVFIREQIDQFMRGGAAEEAQVPALDDEAANEAVDEAANGTVDEAADENVFDIEDPVLTTKVEPEEDSKRIKDKIRRAIKDSKLPKKRTGGWSRMIYCLSPELEAVIGQSQTTRSQVVKLLWEYIRANELQIPGDRKKIRCDEALKRVFKVDKVDMFKMQGKLNKHLIRPDEVDSPNVEEEEEEGENEEELKPEEKRKREASDDEPERGRKARKSSEAKQPKNAKKSEKPTRKTGFAAPVPISTQLKEFLGTHELEMSRGEVNKQMWDYIKSNELQDPSNKKMVLCDEKLQKLFNCDTFSAFGGLSKLLKSHFLVKL